MGVGRAHEMLHYEYKVWVIYIKKLVVPTDEILA